LSAAVNYRAADTNNDIDASHSTDMYNIVLSSLTDAKGNEWEEDVTIIEAQEFDDMVKAAEDAEADAKTRAAAGEAVQVTVKADAGKGTVEVDNGDGTVTVYQKTETTGVDRDGNGTTSVTYTKSTKTADYILEDNDLYGSLQSYRELLTEAGEYSTDKMRAADSSASTKRGIPYYQAALDSLAQQLATTFNRLNQQYKTDESGNYLDEKGKIITYTDTDDKGNTVTLNLNITLTESEIADLVKNGALAADTRALVGNTTNKDAGVLFSSSGTSDDPSGITAANISISQSWANGTVKIVNSFNETVEGQGIPSTASDNIDRFVASFSEKLDYYANDANPMFSGTFQEMLTNISAILGNDVRSTNVLLDNYNAAATELDTSRSSVSGVDLNDEAMNLMVYQKSYSAACRLMTTLDEVLDKLINGTAV
jgi:flagellar hook-associated protein 1 FlgK